MKVLSGDDKVNVKVHPEVILIDDIKSFRAWHKGDNDRYIPGDMTIIVLKPLPEKEVEEVILHETPAEKAQREKDKKRFRTILIEESFRDFRDRINAKVPVRKLDHDPAGNHSQEQGAA